MILCNDVLQFVQSAGPGHIGMVPGVTQQQSPSEHGCSRIQGHPSALKMVDGNALNVVVDDTYAQGDDDKRDDNTEPRLDLQLTSKTESGKQLSQ